MSGRTLHLPFRHNVEPKDLSNPALEFATHFDMPDIGVAWVMPDGLDLKTMEARLWHEGLLNHDFPLDTTLTPVTAVRSPAIAEAFARAQYYADIFIALNPRLAAVTFDSANWDSLRGFIHGVVSGFNEDDLQSWIDKTIDYNLIDSLRHRIADEFRKAAGESIYPQALRRHFMDAAASGRDVHKIDVAYIYWAPSPATIAKITAAFDARERTLSQPVP